MNQEALFEEVRAAFLTIRQAFHSRDVEVVVNGYAPDAALSLVGLPRLLKGSAAIRDAVEEWFKDDSPVDFEIVGMRALGAGAAETWVRATSGDPAGLTSPQRTLMTWVQHNNRWVIASESATDGSF